MNVLTGKIERLRSLNGKIDKPKTIIVNDGDHQEIDFYNPIAIETAIEQLDSDIYEYSDYVQFDGSSYIQTSYLPKHTTKIEMLCCLCYAESYNTYLFGSRSNSFSADQCALLFGSITSYVQFGKSSAISYSIPLNSVVKLELSAEGFVVNGQKIVDIDTDDFSGQYALTIGSCNTNGTLDSRYFKGRIYNFKIYEDDVLVSDFIPLIHQNQSGMYDVVNKKFFKLGVV